MDQEATWGKSHYDGWVYGHGSFGLVSHRPYRLGTFTDRRHSAHAATRLWLEPGQLRGVVETVIMDGNAEAPDLFAEFQRQSRLTLVTTPRQTSDHTAVRQPMLTVLQQSPNRRLRQQRGQTVEPMPGVVRDIFALARCWRRGQQHHRWLFAAMGVTGQLHQARALKRHCSVWKIQQEVFGL